MRIFAVGQIVQYLQDLLDADSLLGDVWIAGEVSNFSRSPAGHCYFTVKDERAQLRSVLFRGSVRTYLPANGEAVIAHGRVTVYRPTGTLQLIVDLVQPEGVGALHLQFELLRQRLEDEGLFDPGRKRPLPACPRRIGLVTSPTGAVLQDIYQVIGRRFPYVELILAPTLVQGERAAAGIAAAIEALNNTDGIDVIVIARGGGSIEDLWPFNEELVARAIFASRVPTVAAIGHETDTTIADFVADYRAPTPSAAAETIVPDARALWQQVGAGRYALDRAIERTLEDQALDVDRVTRRLRAGLPDLTNRRRVIALLGQNLGRAIAARAASAEERLTTRCAQLEALSPRRTLDRGYAIVTSKHQAGPLRDPAATQPGDPLTIQVSRGTLTAEVTGR